MITDETHYQATGTHMFKVTNITAAIKTARANSAAAAAAACHELVHCLEN
jgi:hypothetical protein